MQSVKHGDTVAGGIAFTSCRFGAVAGVGVLDSVSRPALECSSRDAGMGWMTRMVGHREEWSKLAHTLDTWRGLLLRERL